MRLLVILALIVFPTLGHADGDVRKGLYAVLIQPLNPEAQTIETRICWQGASKPNTPLGPMGLPTLRDCPSKARSTEGGTEVTTKCPDGAKALTRYRVNATGFRGWVSVEIVGGRIVRERQTGTWLGRC